MTLAGFELMLISAIMQLGLALPMAYYFHRATVVGLPANLLVIPLMEVLMPAAVAAVAIGFISLTVAKIPAIVAGISLQLIAGTVHWFGALRVADTRVATPALVTILFACAGLAIAMLFARRRAPLTATGLTLLSTAAFWIAAIPPKPQFNAGVMEVTAIDVGQGDSIFVVSPDGRTLLDGRRRCAVVDAIQPGHRRETWYLRICGRAGSRALMPWPSLTPTPTIWVACARSSPIFVHVNCGWEIDSPSPALQAILQQARSAGVIIIPHKAGDYSEFRQGQYSRSGSIAGSCNPIVA